MIVAGYAGKFFEDFSKGEKIVHRLGRTVTYQDNLYFTHSLLNAAPLHFDREYMERTEFGRPILVMTMTLAVAYGITSELFKNSAGELEIRSLRMLAPVFDGDTLHIETEILDLRDHPEREDVGIVVARHRVYKDNFSQLVCEFERELMVYKRSHSPRLKQPFYGFLKG